MSDWSKAVSTGFKAGEAGLAGNRGLQMEELLSFEQDAPGRTGVDLPEPPKVKDRLGGLARKGMLLCFQLFGEDEELVDDYRRRLATLLY